MSFNPDSNKEAIEAYFSIKDNRGNYDLLHFNWRYVQETDSKGYIGFILDYNLNFNGHIKSRITKCSKIIGLKKNFLKLFLEGFD